MGKKRRQHSVGPQVAYPYPTRYGSHSSMLVEGLVALADWVICEDERGKYATEIKKLDNGFHDPWRTCSLDLRQTMMDYQFPDGVDTNED